MKMSGVVWSKFKYYCSIYKMLQEFNFRNLKKKILSILYFGTEKKL